MLFQVHFHRAANLVDARPSEMLPFVYFEIPGHPRYISPTRTGPNPTFDDFATISVRIDATFAEGARACTYCSS